ncbi:hypothetical protein TURBIDO_94 [Mycobacterium phage Turbido]|uniref:Gene product 88 domain-containing protein n=2 Tax=Turbidovirus turbido TaxID=1993865 RepID=G1JUW6_9CAUD|nr:hypothetical protein TURBIDO_94 [Mycobacterium phage Turbido]AEL17774.1 hypothetical protein TURBIDO_94 [Mycobacterium phage Turbido]AWH13611.1 hypothetical protein SEA_ABBYPAIGE_95 [Mycobacterium phage AbbyPaige]
MTTRVETILVKADFGAAVIAGLHGSTDVAWARKVWAELRETVGYKRSAADLLTSGASQQKLSKNSLPSFGLMLTPERGLMAASLRDVRDAFGLTGAFNLCPMASKGCAAACLSRSGQSGMPAQQRAQAVRTAFLLSHPVLAGLLIGAEIRKALRRHGRINLRLNTTSDIRWEIVAPEMVAELSRAGVLMYDYTAWAPSDRAESSDYSLTYSAKEPSHTSDDYLRGILTSGGNVAMPFTTARGEALPEAWNGFRVIDGDKSDERRNDPRGVVVGLRAKGHEWKRDNSAGFIRSA